MPGDGWVEELGKALGFSAMSSGSKAR
jgi:hypothetical protein